MSKRKLTPEQVSKLWARYLTTGEIASEGMPFGLQVRHFRRAMDVLPAEPRCMSCHAPFEGAGGRLLRVFSGKRRSKMNPKLCNDCEDWISETVGGAEVPLTLLFVDVRGSTTLAEGRSPAQFRQLINDFYREATNALVESNALVEKLVGDQVSGLFVPGLAGPDHARVAIETGRTILRATGHAVPGGPWAPAGVGVHTGRAYVGAVGSEAGLTDIAALGDDVNVAARLASQAAAGEILVSEAACQAAGEGQCGPETRRLQLKGRAEPVTVRVLHAE